MDQQKIEQIVKEKTFEVSEALKKVIGTENTITVSIRKPKIPRGPDFVMIYQEIGKQILEGNMCLSTSKVFFYLIMNINFENFIGIDLKSISENIAMPLPTIKKAMKELKSAGMIISIKDNFDARRNIYKLNPLVGWKGKQINRIKIIKQNPDQTMLWNTNTGEQITEHSLLSISKKTLKNM